MADHGTASRYSQKCRCGSCRAAHATAERERLARKPKLPPKPWKIYYTNPCSACGRIKVMRDKQKAARQKFCSRECSDIGMERKGLFENGHPDFVPATSRGHSQETKNKISETLRGNGLRGENHPNWRHGNRSERKQAMAQYRYRDWRKAVFTKDGYSCVMCGSGGTIHADHIYSWSDFPELRYEVSNGRTLCRKCHYFVTFGKDMPEDSKWGVVFLKGGD